MEEQQEHEVYGGEIPNDDGEDVDMSSRADEDQEYNDDPNSKASNNNLLTVNLGFSKFLVSRGWLDSVSFRCE